MKDGNKAADGTPSTLCTEPTRETRQEAAVSTERQPESETETDGFRSTASLSVVRDVDEHDLFRLDFRLNCGDKVRKRTFVLKQTGQSILLDVLEEPQCLADEEQAMQWHRSERQCPEICHRTKCSSKLLLGTANATALTHDQNGTRHV